MDKQQYIEAGKILNTHGVKGEVKIQVWLDSPEFMKKFKKLYIDGAAYKVLSARQHKDMLMVLFEGVNDVNAAMCLKNKTVFVDRKDAKLPRGSYFLQDIIGATVIDENGSEVGKLADIMETPASTIYVVKGETEHLIPAVPEFILKTDADRGIIKVHLIEGM